MRLFWLTHIYTNTAVNMILTFTTVNIGNFRVVSSSKSIDEPIPCYLIVYIIFIDSFQLPFQKGQYFMNE